MMEQSLKLDVLVEGRGVQRGAEVAAGVDGLTCGDVFLRWSDVFFVSRRAGMVMLFGASGAAVIKGNGEDLDRLESWVSDAVNLTEVRRRLVRQLGHEVVLFTAACAARGSLDGRRINGLYVAAATRRALYLISGREQWSMVWPVERVKRELARPEEPGGDALVLARGDETRVSLRYLLPEEVIALATTARKERPGPAEGRPELELFSRGEVSTPQAAELPEFSLAAGSLQAVADRAAANVPGELQTRALMPTGFFELHFLELGEIALGPLLLRKSAAGGADSLERAVISMDAVGLREDTRAAVANATDRTLSVYDEQVDRLSAMKAGGGRSDKDFRIESTERERLAERMQAPFERLWARFEGLEEQQEKLLGRLEEHEAGSPGEEDADLQEAAEEWRATLGRLDGGYEAAWRELVEEIEKTWSTLLLPRLARVTEVESSGPPEWVKLAGIGIATLIVAALVITWLIV
ncbi:MAG: hypothetical protein M8835_09405 [marine benthic group bacterium]|nr:hypothetical protein [Gemmatimonadota bacterium]MCL7956462.1 hypothetical protein [Gemmatimonadota bacterium]MCL7968606.1 hypothetical protein [Gemmatimonadota bacterium]MCL7974754.1 hypothetical protein [Gemmatimonadota bacterium]MCL7977193.1 hypothetical protein [Gemmatimonadota bacterium]